MYKEERKKYMENVLVIGAHPDDIELGCIGTVLKLKSAGKKIIYLVMTNGGKKNLHR